MSISITRVNNTTSNNKNEFRRIHDYREEVDPIYFISNTGKIFSTLYKRFLEPRPDKDGYLRIHLECYDPKRGENKPKLIAIHSLVNLCFNGNYPENMKNPTTDHIDGNKRNNTPSNLRWVENRINASYDLRHIGRNESIPDSEVPKIYELYRNGMTCEKIAKLYNTSFRYIHHILIGKKRVIGLEKYNLTPFEPKKMMTPNEAFSICISSLDSKFTTMKHASEVLSEEYGFSKTAIKHLLDKTSFKNITKHFNFKNKTTDIFDNSKEIGLNSDIMQIGDTLYRY